VWRDNPGYWQIVPWTSTIHRAPKIADLEGTKYGSYYFVGYSNDQLYAQSGADIRTQPDLSKSLVKAGLLSQLNIQFAGV
jgi:hypothetical protein